jgi:hypothetical protein
MNGHILAKVPILGKFVDERFLEHRRRSTSLAGLACLLATGVLFECRYFADHIWNWDLFALIVIFALVKFSTMAWHRLTD